MKKLEEISQIKFIKGDETCIFKYDSKPIPKPLSTFLEFASSQEHGFCYLDAVILTREVIFTAYRRKK